MVSKLGMARRIAGGGGGDDGGGGRRGDCGGVKFTMKGFVAVANEDIATMMMTTTMP